MPVFWIALLHLMAAVMGHGGDGGDEPPHPFGGASGDHQNNGDVEAARARAPMGMDQRSWNAAIDHFLTGKTSKTIHWKQRTPKEAIAEVALQTHHITDSGGDPDTIDWIAIFEKVLGTRRGHVRGIGPKASSTAGTSAQSQWQSQSQAPQPTQNVDVNAFLQNSASVSAIRDIFRSFKNQVNNNEETMMEKSEEKFIIKIQTVEEDRSRSRLL
ncbi:unnamed protein product [Lactuca saligna]|uniref:Uncharacterized protein n=1 Tax=Lactuca saligna TaxID=75948 RepID=A0AA35UU01_LACSI|nr:unnamed protein product [Lactuca saligna]